MYYKLSILLLFLSTLHIQSQTKFETKYDSIALSYNIKAWRLYEIQNDSALFYANKGIEYSITNNSTIGHILNLEIKGIYYEEVKNDFQTASELYFEAIEIAEQNNPELMTSLYNNLCIMYMVTDYEKSEFYGKKAVETSVYDKSSDKHKEKSALVNLGIAQSLLKKYKEAKTTFDRYLAFTDESEYHKNIVNLRIAKNYKEQGLYEKAQPLFLKIVALDSLKGQREYAQDYLQLVENSIQLKDVQTIQKYIPFLEKSNSKERNIEVKRGFNEIMTKVYTFLNKPEKAIEYQTKLIQIKDSINSKLYKKSVIELETKYQTKKKEEQIEQEQYQRKLWSNISIVAFVI
ncbi:tetratricopeptide repeat protein [Polaribacter sp. R77954]|uniref:tetratricopeptide repeat protein n=1 Tax=Polaribacter sp. R77954 TaxID=3093870 RepID=UPI0037CADECE